MRSDQRRGRGREVFPEDAPLARILGWCVVAKCGARRGEGREWEGGEWKERREEERGRGGNQVH